MGAEGDRTPWMEAMASWDAPCGRVAADAPARPPPLAGLGAVENTSRVKALTERVSARSRRRVVVESSDGAFGAMIMPWASTMQAHSGDGAARPSSGALVGASRLGRV